MASNPEKLKAGKQYAFSKTILFSIARQPNTSRLFTGGSDFKVCDLDLAADKPELKEIGKHESYVTGVALAGKTLLSVGYDRRVVWWDVEKRAQVRAIEAHAKWCRNVVASADGKLAASVADDMVCKVWEVESGKLVHELRGHKEKTLNHFPSMLFACAFAPDGKHLATADKVGKIVVWETGTGKPATTLESPEMYTWDPRQRIHSIGGIRGLAFSPDGKQLAVGGIGRIGNIDHLDGKARVEVFDWQAGKRTHTIDKTKFKGIVNRLAFHPEGNWLVAAGGANDGFLFFVDLKTNKVIREEKVKMHLHAIALDETAQTLIAAGHGNVAVFDLKG
jgi:WD40 repeat protein